MNNVIGYKNNIDNITYTESKLNRIDSREEIIKKQDGTTINNSTDKIEITQNNENIINTKKALDSLNETNSQYENPEEQFPPAFYVIMFKSMMEDQGISVPDFKLDGKNPENTNFVDFVEKLKDFAKSISVNDKQFSNLPSSFFQFCDTYKVNLIKNGCK